MTNDSVISYKSKYCAICNNDLDIILEMPSFPLTGIYVDNFKTDKFKPVDQSLLFCGNCQHSQLLNHLNPGYLYHETYSHRSSKSSIATRGNDFFIKYLESVIDKELFDIVLEVGCNDLYMLKKLNKIGKKLYGIDPIWKDNEPKTEDSISVYGKFVEDIDLQTDLEGAPDLVVSTHTFEHINEPRVVLEKLVDLAAPGATIAIEVPSFDTLVELNRFDQVFHQHIHYYSLSSFKYLIQYLGCEYSSHTYNYDYWGGTMIIVFKKTESKLNNIKKTLSDNEIKQSFDRFQNQLQCFMRLVESQKNYNPIYGFGAAQMLPTIAYHLDSDLDWCEAILDDDENRNNKMYPHLPIEIIKPGKNFSLHSSSVFIGALDSVRPILNRILTMSPKRVLFPLSIT